MSEENPFASPPVMAPEDPEDDLSRLGLDRHDRKKANRIIKEAGDVWVVVMFCIPCCVFGVIVIPLYSIRLIQWNYLANKHPALLSPAPHRKSPQAKFKAARATLITGLVLSSVIVICLFLLFFVI